MDSKLAIQILGLHGFDTPSPFDNQYLKVYNPELDGFDPHGQQMNAYIVTTPNILEALQFDDIAAAHQCWAQVSKREPVRPDGLPNRPLTAFTITFVPIPDVVGDTHSDTEAGNN